MARLRLIHLSMSQILSRKTIRHFLAIDPTLASIYEMTPEKLHLQFSIPFKTATRLYTYLHNEDMRKKFSETVKRYKIVTIIDAFYPTMLKMIEDAPLVLYCLGDLSLFQENKVLSVIGSRQPSSEAKPKMDHILTPLIQEGWLIVSGMARGVDGYAHTLTLSHQGKTIAVLGGGFEYIYPKEHIPLFKKIASTGLVISEYPPFMKPARYHFPERNRIISGLSFGTLVIEAMEKSGTMITVEQALDQGREVFAVPGSPLVPQTKGCHRLIQEGAKLTQNADDIRIEWLSQNEDQRHNMLSD